MFFQDTFRNLVSGLGTDRDKTTQGHFRHRLLSKAELDGMYTSDWLSGKIIDAPVDDSTREWRVWDGGPKQTAALEAAERTLKVRQTVNRAKKLARLYGGAVILIGTGDADPFKPLDPASVRRGGLQYLHALSRWEITAGPLDRDPLSPHFGAPEYYELNGGARAGVNIHPSRVVRFLGQAPLEIAYQWDGWGLSTLQRVYEAVRHSAQASGNVAALTNEAKSDVIKVPGLNQNSLDPNYQSRVIARFSLANIAKSTINATLLDASEEWSQRQVSFASLPEVVRMFLEVVAGAADIPATRLLSTSPKGMNATGASDVRNYYDMISSKQEIEDRPALAVLDEVLIRHALGARPSAIGFHFLPLWQMDEAESAAIELQHAQADQIYGVLGAMPPSALRAGIQGRLRASRQYPGLGEALDAAAAAGEAPAPLLAKSDVVETNSPKPTPAKTT